MSDILLIEDHMELAELTKIFLYKEGFRVEHVTNAQDALTYLCSYKPKVILLDIMLPDIDGFSVCKMIRQTYDLPILILSARVQKDDKLMGFELGADDYMEKPVDPDILCAKVKALIARAEKVEGQSDIIQSGSIRIDCDAHKVFLKDRQLELNVKEYELLLLFVKNPGKTLHKEYLFSQIWGADSFSENQTLTVHIKMLRTKIEVHAKRPMRIQTVWGVGYRYEEI